VSAHSLDDTLLTRWVRAPGRNDHKYSRGVLGILTGSTEYPGAALLGVSAALRTGIGMVRYLGPADVRALVVTSHPEVVVTPGSVDACVIGSGMPSPLSDEAMHAVSDVAARGVPIVLDAGGLSAALACGPATVLTPHSGELATLYREHGLDGADSDIQKASELATLLGKCVLVKGSNTVIVDSRGEQWHVPTATPWLATAGTGDALAGIMGAVFAANASTLLDALPLLPEAAAAAALIHQRAALKASIQASSDQSPGRGGPITVSDLIAQIPAVIAEIVATP
jgi:hydroxyethylthiazole kinase-like uncharacterized protein yjeF